jgi:branched-chain amino acid transport system substrate-binding protein
MNEKKVPQLFVASGAAKWNDPKNFPWTMGWQPDYQREARIYARYILREKPEGKISILYQNDDYGRDYLKGIEDGLGDRAASMIVAKEAYEAADPTVDSQIVSLRAKGADIFISITTPKFAAQSIRKVAELGWRPLFILNNVSASIGSVIRPGGFENAQGIVSAAYLKHATDPQWDTDPGMNKINAFLDKYFPAANRSDADVMTGYSVAQTLATVIRRCGDDLTRENVMKQAAGLKDLELDGLLPGIRISTGPTDFAPIKQLRLMKFKGDRWELFGPVIGGEVGG